jgi:hypothetical protein
LVKAKLGGVFVLSRREVGGIKNQEAGIKIREARMKGMHTDLDDGALSGVGFTVQADANM